MAIDQKKGSISLASPIAAYAKLERRMYAEMAMVAASFPGSIVVMSARGFWVAGGGVVGGVGGWGWGFSSVWVIVCDGESIGLRLG